MIQVSPSKIESAPYSIPQKETLSPTDQKIYFLVIISRLLIAVSIACGACACTFAFTINPLFALGIIPSIVLAEVGLLINPQQQTIPPQTHVITDQPLGLNNQSGADCWINSVFQLFANIPILRAKIDQKSAQPFYDALCHYETAPINQLISVVQTRKLGEWIYDLTYRECHIKNGVNEGPITSRNGRKQEDAAEFLRAILDHAGVMLPLDEKTVAADGTERVRPSGDTEPFISLTLPSQPTNFQSIWNSYFSQIVEDTSQQQMKSFAYAPEDFSIQLKRFATGGWDRKKNCAISPSKIEYEIDVPFEIALKEEQCLETARYQCDGFIVHSGTLKGGHYTAYVFKMGKWWHLNDSNPPLEMSVKSIQKMMSKGYIFHYSKLESRLDNCPPPVSKAVEDQPR